MIENYPTEDLTEDWFLELESFSDTNDFIPPSQEKIFITNNNDAEENDIFDVYEEKYKKDDMREGCKITSISLDREWTKCIATNAKEFQHCANVNFSERKERGYELIDICKYFENRHSFNVNSKTTQKFYTIVICMSATTRIASMNMN